MKVYRYANGIYKISKRNPNLSNALKMYHWLKKNPDYLAPLHYIHPSVKNVINSPPLNHLLGCNNVTADLVYKLSLAIKYRCGVTHRNRSEASKKRTKNKIREILINNLDTRSWLLTLTFAEDITSYDLAYSIFNNFIKGKNLKYMLVKELQNLNRISVIHYHMILFDVTYKITDLFSNWYEKYGLYHLTYIHDRNVNKLANYFINYIFNDNKNQMIDDGKKLFTTSRNLKIKEEIGGAYLLYLIDRNVKQGLNNLFKQIDQGVTVSIEDYGLFIVDENKRKLEVLE